MLIGELVEKSGMTKDTIRFYEKKGLISPGRKSRRSNNYREYSHAVLNKLAMIRQLKELGFTLGEINLFFDLWKREDASCENVKFVLERKIAQVQENITKLFQLRETLSASLRKCHVHDCDFERAIPSVSE